jgi:hypothetical protein
MRASSSSGSPSTPPTPPTSTPPTAAARKARSSTSSGCCSIDFWDSHNGTLDPDAWERRFVVERDRARRALAASETLTVLGIVLDRIYTLRNQVVHGGSTWDSDVNREQVRDCARFMGELVPVIIEIMMDNPQTVWGSAVYPVVKD